MTAKVSGLFICPKCEHALSAVKRPLNCPRCRYIFKDPNKTLAKDFTWEKLPADQLFEIVQQETERLLDASNEEIFDKKMPEELTIHRKTKVLHIKNLWQRKLDDFLMDTNQEQVEELMKLVAKIMALAVPSGDLQKAKAMAILGGKIGKIAAMLENYIDNGGRFIQKKVKHK